jgi:hypothetical protein
MIGTPSKTGYLCVQGVTSLAIVNSQVMLLGDRKSIRAALDAYAAQVEPGDSEENPVANRAAELAAQYDVWLVSTPRSKALATPWPLRKRKCSKASISSSSVFSLRGGFKADISLHGRTPEDTSKLGMMLARPRASWHFQPSRKRTLT